MSNLWYILNKSEHQQRLNQQLQQQLRQQLELPPSGMSSDRFQFPPNNGQPAAPPVAGTAVPPPSRDILPFGQQYPPQQHADVPFDPNAPAPAPGESHNNIEWKYHTHRPEADGDSLGRKAGKRKLVIPRDLLKMKQMNAALKIGIPPSTFSKRWRESLPDRTWPYRNHRRIEKNIKMLKAMQQKGHDVTEELGRMQQQQEENLSPAVIDVYEDVNEEYLMKVDDKRWPAAGAAAGRPPGGPPTPHHHPYPPPQLPPSSQQPQPQLQIAAIPHSQIAHPIIQPQLPHSPPSQSKLAPQQPHPQQAQAQPPLQTSSIQASPIQPSPALQSPAVQSPAQTSPVQTTPIQAPSIQSTPIQTSPIQPTPPPQQIPPTTQPLQPTISLQSQMLPPQSNSQDIRHQTPPLASSQPQPPQHAEHAPTPADQSTTQLKIDTSTPPPTSQPASTPSPQDQPQQPPSTFPQVQLSAPPPT